MHDSCGLPHITRYWLSVAHSTTRIIQCSRRRRLRCSLPLNLAANFSSSRCKYALLKWLRQLGKKANKAIGYLIFKMKESFILYTSQYSAIEKLTKTAKGELLDALYRYAIDGKQPAFSSQTIEMAFNFIRIRIDENNAKYQSICEKRKAAGRKGGRPRKYNAEASAENQKANKANAFSKSKAKQKKLTDTESIINTDTLSEVEVSTSQKKQKEKKARENADDISNLNYDEDEKYNKFWEDWYMSILQLFNKAVTAHGSAIKPVQTLSDNRRVALHLLETKYRYTGKHFKQAFRNIAVSNYCNGRTKDRRRPVDFDWLIREDNFNRALEGSL